MKSNMLDQYMKPKFLMRSQWVNWGNFEVTERKKGGNFERMMWEVGDYPFSTFAKLSEK